MGLCGCRVYDGDIQYKSASRPGLTCLLCVLVRLCAETSDAKSTWRHGDMQFTLPNEYTPFEFSTRGPDESVCTATVAGTGEHVTIRKTGLAVQLQSSQSACFHHACVICHAVLLPHYNQGLSMGTLSCVFALIC